MKNDVLNKLKIIAKKNHWRIEQTSNGHWKFFSPNGKDIVLVGSKIINDVTKNKILSHFKKAGLNI